ncbi:MAG TPA: MATE family efflux transporter [Stellaceae bacterium]|nr:MATE family efflux transporter [Stellaceae bacterium]
MTISSRQLWRLAIPIILANLTVPLLGAVDTALAGHFQNEAYLGGVALGGQVFTLLYWSLSFLRMGTTGLTAQSAGEGSRRLARLIFWRGLILASALGSAFILLEPVILYLLHEAVRTGPDVRAVADLYISVRLWSAPASLGNFVVLGWLLGRLQARTALGLQLLINGVNAVLALFFVIGLGWGVAGIAGATALADGIGLAVGLSVVCRPLERETVTLTWRELIEPQSLGQFMAINRDIFVRTLCLLAAFALFTLEGARQGDLFLATNAVLLTFQNIASFGLDGIAQATEVLVGAAIGAGDRPGFRQAARLSLISAFLAGGVMSLVFLVTGPLLITLLSDLPEIIANALTFLPWVVLWPLIAVWGYQLDGIFIGATRAREMRNAMGISLALFVLAALSLEPAFGNHGLWAALTLFMASRAITLAFYFTRIERHIIPVSSRRESSHATILGGDSPARP